MNRIVFLVLILSGCESASWTNAPKEYKCTAEQMIAVEEQTLFCNDNTTYVSGYCYGTAIIRNCNLLQEKESG